MNTRTAKQIYLIMRGMLGVAFRLVFTISTIYYITIVGLDPLQLVLVGTTLEVAALIFEVPTGIMADTVSRKLSVVIGFALVGLGFTLEGFVPHFAAILAAQVIWGLGYTFISGAFEAWIADEVGPEQTGEVFMRGSQIGQVAAMTGIAISIAIAATTAVNIPMICGGITLIGLAIFGALMMPETGFRPAERDGSALKTMTRTFKDGLKLVRVRPVVLTLVLLIGILGLFSEGYDRLWRAHVLEDFTLPVLGRVDTVVWFGIIEGAAYALSILVVETIRKRLDMTRQLAIARMLLILQVITIGGMAAFALTQSFAVAVVAIWVIAVARQATSPVYDTWLNQHIDSEVRATVISMTGQTNAIGQIAGGPVVGWIGTVRSIRAALMTSTLLLVPALPLLASTRKKLAHAPGVTQAAEQPSAPA